jgi:anti-sigma regulatory factor (Ser/Thr protein kinase)/ActR/RegA family two-component response regulator
MSRNPHDRARIVFAGPDTPRAEVLAEILAGLGHELRRAAGRDEVLRSPQPDLYVVARTLADGSNGLALLAALRRLGRGAAVILIDERPSFQELRQAIELGVADVVLRPCEPGELAGAVTRALSGRRPAPARTAYAPGGERPPLYERRYPAEPGSVGWAARELSAYLMERGVVAAHRVRIASALSELVDNASRHAYPRGQGEVLVRAVVERTRVHLEIADRGTGLDPCSRLESVRPALPGRRGTPGATGTGTGLGRVERLCEALAIRSAEPGTSVELLFELTPVRFHEEPEDFSEIDFLDPARARALLESLRRGDTDLSSVSPALAITIGRLLAGPDPSSRQASRR